MLCSTKNHSVLRKLTLKLIYTGNNYTQYVIMLNLNAYFVADLEIYDVRMKHIYKIQPLRKYDSQMLFLLLLFDTAIYRSLAHPFYTRREN